jgi:glutaredoxin
MSDQLKHWTEILDGGVVEVVTLPGCDFCHAPARYDTKTTQGPWAYACGACYERHGVGRLGLGLGQMLVQVHVECERPLPEGATRCPSCDPDG